MDLSVYEWLNGLTARHVAVEDLFRFVADSGVILFLLLLAVLSLGHGRWRSLDGRRGVAAAGLSALLALGVSQVIGSLWDRPRPYEAHPAHAHLLLGPSPDPSFPSDHATAAFAIAVAILLRNRKGGIVALALAVAVSVSRVALGTHYPSDVLGGALLGTLAALTLWLPPIRRALDHVTDRVGAAYDRVLDSLSRPTASRTP